MYTPGYTDTKSNVHSRKRLMKLETLWPGIELIFLFIFTERLMTFYFISTRDQEIMLVFY